MKFSTAVAALATFGAGVVSANPHRGKLGADPVHNAAITRHVHARDYPGLTPAQSKHIPIVLASVKKNGLGMQGCQTAVAIAMTESELKMLANAAVPQSLQYPNEGMGAEKDSVGLYQMRAQWFDVKCSMDASCSTDVICKGIKAVQGWQTMDVATLCQTVQRSEIPEAYKKYTAAAAQVCQASKMF